MVSSSFRKGLAVGVAKKAAVVSAVSLLAASAYAEAPNVTEAVSDISALQAPVALIGGAYIGLKVFQRGWRIIKGFI